MDEENAGGSAAPKDQSTQVIQNWRWEPVSNGESAVDPGAPKSYEQHLFEFCHQRICSIVTVSLVSKPSLSISELIVSREILATTLRDQDYPPEVCLAA